MKLKNKYYIMRHGQAISNVERLCSCQPETFENPLTESGRGAVRQAAEKLSDRKIDLIFASPLLRTQQTAEIVAGILKIKPETDERLREIQFGIYNGKHLEGMWKSFKKEAERIKKGADGGETYKQILERMEDFLKSTEKKYKEKNILIIGHECPLFLLQGKVMGLTINKTIEEFPDEKRIHKAEIRELN